MKKAISTEQTSANIAEVLHILNETPERLKILSARLTPEQLITPLGLGERTPTEVMAHLVNTEERNTEAIYAALLLKEPLVLPLHPERDWGRLLRYDQLGFGELLAYFTFRRAVLLRVLSGLTDAQWTRMIREEGKQRKETVYWRVRGQALHEFEHVEDLERKLLA